jgi:hypothetical protein
MNNQIPEVPLKFEKVSGEDCRVYHYPNGSTFMVEGVTGICVRPSGTHRLETKDGRKWIVASGWSAISITAAHWSL